MEQSKILDLINILLNLYVKEGNIPWERKNVEIEETPKGKKLIIK